MHRVTEKDWSVCGGGGEGGWGVVRGRGWRRLIRLGSLS